MSDSVHIRSFSNADKEAVVALWRACGLVVPQNDPVKDIDRKMRIQPEAFLVAVDGSEVVGTVMAGYEGHRGWINYLAVAPLRQRRSIGRRLMAAAETLLRSVGCPKINLQVRKTNTAVIAFYQQIGYVEDAVLSFGKRLEVDHSPSIR
jgi:ribosomal protein S18 acetylase RimI-like enzyme